MSLSTLTRLSSALGFVALLGLALPDPGVAGSEPAMATSGDPDDYTVEAGDPDDHRAESRDPDDLKAESKDPDDMRAESKDPDSLLTTSGDPDDHLAESTDLDDLKRATPPAAPGSNRGGPQAHPEDGLPTHEVRTFAPHHSSESGSGGGSWEAKLAIAKARLDGARRDVDRWNAEYSRSVNSNTSRGQARAEIVTNRNNAKAKVSDAEKELHAIAASARRAGVNPMIIEGFSDAR